MLSNPLCNITRFDNKHQENQDVLMRLRQDIPAIYHNNTYFVLYFMQGVQGEKGSQGDVGLTVGIVPDMMGF